jgi:hypothetical protein
MQSTKYLTSTSQRVGVARSFRTATTDASMLTWSEISFAIEVRMSR